MLTSAIDFICAWDIYLPGLLLCAVLACLMGLAVIGRKKRARLAARLREGSRRGRPLRRFGLVCLWLLVALCWVAIFGALFIGMEVSLAAFGRFVLFFLVYLVLPGYPAARGMRKLRSPSVLFAVSAVSGMGLLLLVYVAASLLGADWLLRWTCPAVSLLSLVLLVRDVVKKTPAASQLRVDGPLFAVVSLLLTYTVLVRVPYGISPELSGSARSFMDSLYIVTNSAALKGGLFAESLNFPGFYLRYHIVTNILQACAGLQTGISAVEIFFVFWPFLYMPVAVCAVHGLLVTFQEREEHASVMTLLVFVSELFTFGTFHIFDTPDRLINALYMGAPNLEAYLLVLPNGNDIAIPAILCAALVGVKFYRDEAHSVTSILLACLFALVATGAKAVYGVCLCGALAGTLLLSLLQGRGVFRRLEKPALLFFAYVLGFAAAYIIMIYNPTQSAVSTVSLFDPFDFRSSFKLETNYWFLTRHLEELGIVLPETVIFLIAFPLSLFILLPYVIVPFFAYCAGQLRRFRSIRPETMLLCGVAVCGLGAYYCINMDGYSQIYFLLAGICFIHILGQCWLEEHAGGFTFFGKAVLTVLLALSIFSTSVNGFYRVNQALITFEQVDKTRTGEAKVPKPGANSITAYEYEGMVWLRENTPVDAVVVSDRMHNAPLNGRTALEAIDDSLYFYYAAYSERQMYLGAFSYSPRTPELESYLKDRLDLIDRLYSAKTEERAPLLTGSGISYMVVSRFMNPDLDLKGDDSLRCVFENRDIAIYAPA